MKNLNFLLPLGGLMVVAGLAAVPAAFADTAIHGSIRLPMAENPHATKAQQAAEARQLPKFAKLTRDQAIAAAHHISKGRVDKVVLENEDGYLCYAVFLGGHEVLVDAGNGKILGDEVESPNAHD